MNRKTLTALAAFALLAVVAIIALRQPEKGERKDDRPARPFAKINPGDVDTVDVTKNGATTTIKKDGGKYKITAPVAYAADEPAAKSLFEAVEKLDFTDLVSEQKAKHAEFEVDDVKGLHVVARSAKQGDKVLADLIVGRAAGGGTMVRPAGKDQVWQTSGASRFVFDKNPTDWRDKSITTFTAADAETIDVKARDGSHVALKKTAGKEAAKEPGKAPPPAPEKDSWAVADSSLKIDKLDGSVPSGMVSALATWKANDFADGAKPADTGLDAPALTVTVGLKGGKSVTVLVGNKKGDDEVYVKKSDSPQLFVVKKWNADRVNKRPAEFRDKTLCDVAEADLTEIAVSHGENSFTLAKGAGSKDWKATKPAKLELDPAKVTPVAGAFKDWKATGVAEDPSPKTAGLVKPQAVIAAKGKGSTCTIKIGDETKDKQSYFAQSGKGPDVYLVAKWAADRVLVKTDDLKKPGSGNLAKK